jgi:hypothetical protein
VQLGGQGHESKVTERYDRTRDIAARLGIKPKTLRNKVSAGIFREGEHFYRKAGLGRLWKWEAVVASIEGNNRACEVVCGSPEPVVPLARPGVRRDT